MSRDHCCGFSVSQTSPATLSHEPRELRSPGTLPPAPCSLPLWSALELPMRTGLAEETVRDAWNQTEACSNPVIKILRWMLILWKKPNDFTACLISESDEQPESIQQNGSTLYTICAAGRKSASMWGSGRRRRKGGAVLYYKARHWSQIFVLRSKSWVCSKTWKEKEVLHHIKVINGLYQTVRHYQPLSFVPLALSRSAGVLFSGEDNARVISTISACAQALQAICCPDTAALSQPSDSVNTEATKRWSIVLLRLKLCLELMTPSPTESWFLRPLDWHWWSSRGHWQDVVTAFHPQLPTEWRTGAWQCGGVAFSSRVMQQVSQHVDPKRRMCLFCHRGHKHQPPATSHRPVHWPTLLKCCLSVKANSSLWFNTSELQCCATFPLCMCKLLFCMILTKYFRKKRSH